MISALPSFGQDPSFSIYIDNPAYSGPNDFEFDVMVMASGSTTSFQLRTFQAGIYVDPSWVGAGSISVTTVSGSSQLASPSYNGAFNWNASDKFINCSVNIGVRPSVATCYSTTVGTGPIRIARLKLTNSMAFSCVPPNLKFNYVQNASPLRLRTSVSWRQTGCSVNYDMFYPNRAYSGSAYFNGELYTTADSDGRSPASLIANSLPCTVPFNLVVLLQGYYSGMGQMQPVLLNQGVAGATGTEADSIEIQLRDIADPSIIVNSTKSLLATDGTTGCTFPSSVSSGSYWLLVRHRNSVETWSANPISIVSNGTYNFTSSQAQAYGGNLTEVEPGVFAIYTGDIDQDGYVTPFDFPIYELDNFNLVGPDYASSDLDGDGYVTPFDFPVYELNNFNLVGVVNP